MNNDDEIIYDTKVIDGGKKIVLTIECTSALSNQEYIMALEAHLSDLVRAVNQIDLSPTKITH